MGERFDLVSPTGARHRRSRLPRFPGASRLAHPASAGLTDPGLAESGIYKDGWLQKGAKLVLAGGPAGQLSLRAVVTCATRHQHLEFLVNGKTIVSQSVKPGSSTSTSRSALPTTPATLKCTASRAAISSNDPRQASALLSYISVAATHAPDSITNPAVQLPDPGSLRVASTRTAG